MIDINEIIDVDFSIITSPVFTSTYDTALYITTDTSASTYVSGTTAPITATSQLSGTPSDLLKANVNIFFNNSGKKLLVVKVDSSITKDTLVTLLKTIKTDYPSVIYVVLDNALSSILASVCADIYELKAPNTLRICYTVSNTNELTGCTTYPLFVKYADQDTLTVSSVAKQLDSALAFAAFTTQIDLDTYNAIEDYCYTQETGLKDATLNSSVTFAGIKDKFNFVNTLGSTQYNFGGNLYNTTPIDTDFGAIAIENDIVTAILALITSKIRITTESQTKIVTAINGVLNKYINNGLILSNSVFNDSDINITYNSKVYNVIKKGTTLLNGYYVFTVPVSNISADDKTNKKFTPIVIVIITSAGARTISVTGNIY